MSRVRYLLDEHVDPTLRVQLIRHAPDLLVWMIGDLGAPRCGTLDPDILLLLLDQDKLTRVQRLLKAQTETEAVDRASDQCLFGEEVMTALLESAGKGKVVKGIRMRRRSSGSERYGSKKPVRMTPPNSHLAKYKRFLRLIDASLFGLLSLARSFSISKGSILCVVSGRWGRLVTPCRPA